MRYRIVIKEEALRDLKKLSPEVSRRILLKIQALENDLAGNVKRLTRFTPEYRLRVGDWRVLFDIEENSVVVQHVSHRSKAYD
ncbi:MAG TPA: type II toxin-antitoxin system RelE/ParE family toxin [Tepidisphaeraceae bacterium]|nr:type II toxin-antitoxin system RelE/ParE family toxin [Tepidisphaeraceae bacterium]